MIYAMLIASVELAYISSEPEIKKLIHTKPRTILLT